MWVCNVFYMNKNIQITNALSLGHSLPSPLLFGTWDRLNNSYNMGQCPCDCFHDPWATLAQKGRWWEFLPPVLLPRTKPGLVLPGPKWLWGDCV